MASSVISFLGEQLRSAAIGPVWWLFVLALFAYVMSRNFRHIRTEIPSLKLDGGEIEVAALHVRRPLLRTHTYLTSRRVVQGRFSWWLSGRKVKAVSLDEVHSITWRRSANWVLLFLALNFLNSFNPAALLLLLFGLEAKVYLVRFGLPFAQMPFSSMLVASTSRRQLPEIRAFYEQAHEVWSRMIVEKRLASPVGVGSAAAAISIPISDDRERDFSWGGTLLFYVSAVLMLSLGQRLLGPHVSFDDYMFGPLYVGLITGVAVRDRRDGVWLALLASVALFAMKFPGTGVFSVLLSADGGSPLFEEYAVLLAVLITIAVAASLLGRISVLAGGLAVALWLVVPAITSTGTALDWAVISKVLLAMAWASLIPLADEGLRSWFSARQDAH